MALFEKFGEFDSAEELNEAAKGLKEEGDLESLKALFAENGLEPEDAEDFMDGEMNVTGLMAAVGKLNVEKEALKLPGDILISDWVGYICRVCSEDAIVADSVRKKSKSLAGCIAEILKVAYKNQWTVPQEVTEKAAVGASKVTFGIPSEAAVRKIIRNYYGGAK